jgi:hypothetical protein
MAPVLWSFATVDADSADSNLPSCTTRLIRAKLKRRVHWFFVFFILKACQGTLVFSTPYYLFTSYWGVTTTCMYKGL